MSRLSRVWIGVVAFVALALTACLIGLLTTGLRLAVAGLSPGHGLFLVPIWHSILIGLIVIGVGCVTFALSCVLAYVAASRRWDFHGRDWWDIIEKGGVRKAWDSLHAPGPEGQARRAARDARRRRVSAGTRENAGDGPGAVTQTPAGNRLLRVLAGFNLLVLGGVLALGVGQIVDGFESAWWAVVPAGLIAFLVVHLVLTSIGPLDARPGVHVLSWVAVGALAALTSPPVALLVVTGVVISTAGRIFVRNKASKPLGSRLLSPLPSMIAALYTAVAVGYLAMPPVSFDGVTVQTASAQFIGGDLDRSSDTVDLIMCTPLADATSIDARLQDVPTKRVVKISPNGHAAFDSGDRPSLPALALNLIGINWPPAIIVPNLHARQPTCAGAPPPRLSAGSEDPALGAGAIASSGPTGGRAADGEPPIEQTTDRRIARLARRFQPTLEVSVADRFWPVSVGAVLDDIGPNGTRACLVTPAVSSACAPVTSVPATGRPTDYLRFPTTANVNASALTENPAAQFRAFEAGQHTITGPLHHWLADPGILDPWHTPQVYFYYAGPVHFGGVRGQLPRWPAVDAVSAPLSGVLIGLEYWFFYPYNYYPVVTRSSLMNGAPIAGDVENVDLHQGDWEHVDVLLDQHTLAPVALYMARHANEAPFYSWNSPKLRFDGGGRLHPIVQAAFGGHPSYPNACGGYQRSQGGGALYDWVVCGGGRYAFRADNTPLVDLGQTNWSCWPGHFGEAKHGREIVDASADTLTTAIAKYIDVAGPVSPLWQAENGSDPTFGVCKRGAGATETSALHGPLTPLLTSTFGR